MSKPTRAGLLAKALLDEYPTAGSLTLAKRLHRDHPEVFKTIDNARMVINYHRGQKGVKNRRKLADLTHVKDLDKVLADKFNLPEPAVNTLEPYRIPKVNDKIICFGDTHFPFQNNDAIYKALEYAAGKAVNCFILNGDIMDGYDISRFTKEARKPNLEYELEVVYDFLHNLRDCFPNALIVWKFGNHEQRWDEYLKVNAPLLHMIGTERLEDHIPVQELGVQVVKDKRRIVAGDLNILHGHEYNGGGGQVNPARTMSIKAKVNTLVNHFHRSSSHKEMDLNGNVTRYYSLGAMCSRQSYAPYGNQDCSFGWLRVIDGITYVQNREV